MFNTRRTNTEKEQKLNNLLSQKFAGKARMITGAEARKIKQMTKAPAPVDPHAVAKTLELLRDALARKRGEAK